MRARKAGANGAQRGGAVKPSHAKPRGGTKPTPARAAKPSVQKEAVSASVKKTVPVAATGNGGLAAVQRAESAGHGLHASPPPRGNPPPLPAPIASFNF